MNEVSKIQSMQNSISRRQLLKVGAFVRAYNNHQAPMTFNVGIYQDGTMANESIEKLRRLGANLKA